MLSHTTVLEKLFRRYRRQSMRTKALFWVIIGMCIILLIPPTLKQRRISQLSPARLYFAANSTTIIPGQMFPVEVRVQTSGTPVNAVGAHILFNPAFLEIVNMTTEKSFCTFYLENTFDNMKGEVNVSCGLPSPGFQGDSIVVRVNMRAKASGTTTLKLNEKRSQVLANDGLGTDLAKELPILPLLVQPLL
jgi:hypothetical protein